MFFNKRHRFLLAILYFCFISFLFVLPGSAFPKNNWLDKIWFDKWVHIGLFAALIFIWSRAVQQNHHSKTLIIAAALYGIVVELIQHQFVANRSFDLGDWIADLVGIAAGVFVWRRYKKNRPL